MPKTKRQKLAVIGDPIAHSLSPLIQNAALKKAGLAIKYEAKRIRPEALRSFLEGEARGLLGFNITVPHKVAVIPYLDRLAIEAKLVGAVNTVLNQNGKLIGFNTDGAGYLMSLQLDAHFKPRGKKAVLLGAGGAARAIAMSLGLDKIRSLTIANRTLAHAEDLARDLKKNLPKLDITTCPLEGKVLASALKKCELLINTTNVGLDGSRFSDFPWFQLKNRALVSDVVYRPRLTPFLKAAKKAGHPTHTGEGMLIYQGALAFEIWTGTKADVALMRRTLLKALKES